MVRTRTGALARALLLGVFLFCGGCILIDAFQPEERGLTFSHDLHVAEEGLDCISCHENVALEEEPGMPSFDACDICHYDLDEGKAPEETIASLFGGEDYFTSSEICALEEEVIFDHRIHVGLVENCSECHVGIETNRAITETPMIRMDACVRCHEERQAPSDCSTCHTEINEDWVPATHFQNWPERHGRACRRPVSEDTINDCSMCHTESSCVQCHKVVPPTNHNAFFRLRGHAIHARVDRQNCSACHEPASCDRCHEETIPRNHTGLFGSTRNMHCVTCHLPLQQSGCVTCHKSTPSHDLAPPKPAWHNPGMVCRQCHGQPTLPLEHVDDGTNCNLCHK